MNALQILADCGGYISDSHIVYTSGRHGSAYLNKDAIYPHTKAVSALCLDHAHTLCIAGERPDVVIGPEKGGIILAQWTAFHLSNLLGKEVLAVYAEKEGDGFTLRRGQDALVRGKSGIIVEDVITTGGSVQKVIAVARALDCDVIAVMALFNRGSVTFEQLGCPRLCSLANVHLDSWPEDDCPLCRDGVPINTVVGKGREFLTRRTSSS